MDAFEYASLVLTLGEPVSKTGDEPEISYNYTKDYPPVKYLWYREYPAVRPIMYTITYPNERESKSGIVKNSQVKGIQRVYESSQRISNNGFFASPNEWLTWATSVLNILGVDGWEAVDYKLDASRSDGFLQVLLKRRSVSR